MLLPGDREGRKGVLAARAKRYFGSIDNCGDNFLTSTLKTQHKNTL